MNVVFTGGGTGGHVYPAIAIADALRDRADITFIGTSGRMESRIVPESGYAFTAIGSRPWARKRLRDVPAALGVNAYGVVQSLAALQTIVPDLIVASGGYVCFPVVAAAGILRGLRRIHAPVALLEPNVRPGLTNRLLAPLVDEVWGAFPESGHAFRAPYVRTGVPVRAALRRPHNRIEAARRLGLEPNRHTLLVMGGSLGARSINEAVAALVTRRALPRDWQVLHVSGERDHAYMQAEERPAFGDNHVVLVPYLHDLADAYAVSDAAVARAGASTLGEFAALGIPSILIPYPLAAEDHQRRNARAFEEAGAAVMIDDGDLSADTLWWTFAKLLDESRLPAMRESARTLAPLDPLAAILALIDALTARKKVA